MSEHTCLGSRFVPPNLYADIVVPRHLAGSYTYLVPEPLKPVLRVGHCVLVPFGRSSVQGAVISLAQTLAPGLDRKNIKEIRAIVSDQGLSEIPHRLMDLAKRVAEYYVAPLGQCLRLVMPPVGRHHMENGRLRLTECGREALSNGPHSGDVRSLLKRLSRKPKGIKRSTLLARNRSRQEALLDDLHKKGWIGEDLPAPAVLNRTEPSRQPHPVTLERFASPSVLRQLQEQLSTALEKRQTLKLFLEARLSDRLALLQQAIHAALSRGRTALVIVGEADRAIWLTDVLATAGVSVSACLHSNLTGRERASIWHKVRCSDPQVVVGTRSAVFLPVHALGMIWVERDEEAALKEPQEPRYHARDVAWFRAQDEEAIVVFSSAHPHLDAVAPSKIEGQEAVLCEASPVTTRPNVEAVDLRLLSQGTVLSPLLIETATEAINRHTGVLLFLNRKGYGSALVCQDCGQIPRCKSCSVALAYYRERNALVCAYCGSMAAILDTCAFCMSHRLYPIGEGTERVEQEVRRLFPDANIIRADGETMKRPVQAAALWKCIRNRQWDILIGTQLVLRDYVLPPVGLAAAIHSDTDFSFPDFRAAERAYRLLRDMVSLVRPSSEGGRVIVQSCLVSHHAIQAIVRQDESIFISEELFHREALRYPPFVSLIALQTSGADENLVQQASTAWAARLHQSLAAKVLQGRSGGRTPATDTTDDYAVLGPVPAAVPRVRGRYRWQILVKSAM
ncbi:MAG TPA: primosomal protein N', partial [Nitrospira sp.]